MANPRKPKNGWPTGRQSKANLDALVYIILRMMAELTKNLPMSQQVQVADSVLQAIAQRLNWQQDKRGKDAVTRVHKPIHKRAKR